MSVTGPGYSATSPRTTVEQPVSREGHPERMSGTHRGTGPREILAAKASNQDDIAFPSPPTGWTLAFSFVNSTHSPRVIAVPPFSVTCTGAKSPSCPERECYTTPFGGIQLSATSSPAITQGLIVTDYQLSDITSMLHERPFCHAIPFHIFPHTPKQRAHAIRSLMFKHPPNGMRKGCIRFDRNSIHSAQICERSTGHNPPTTKGKPATLLL